MPWKWVDMWKPDAPGWYATIHCWDVQEGFFPRAHYWDGQEWSEKRPFIQMSPNAFATEKEAEEWAYKNDPEV